MAGATAAKRPKMPGISMQEDEAASRWTFLALKRKESGLPSFHIHLAGLRVPLGIWDETVQAERELSRPQDGGCTAA